MKVTKPGLLTATLLTAGLAILAGPASATILKKLTLAEIEDYASEAFVGTVLSTECFEDDGPRNLIYTEVTFGSQPAASTEIVNPGLVLATTPPGSPGDAVDVKLSNASGSARLAS